MTNAEFAKTEPFKRTCRYVGIPPTARQASRWRNSKGLAYKNRVAAAKWWFAVDAWRVLSACISTIAQALRVGQAVNSLARR
jgi:hypothetical protein